LADSNFIEQEIEAASHANQKAIVLTNHKPLENRPGACTDLRKYFKSPLVAWCYGHTHCSENVFHKNVRVVSNQLGYEYCMGEQDLDFFTEFTREIDEQGSTWTSGGDSRAKKLWLQKQAEEKATNQASKPMPLPPPPPKF